MSTFSILFASALAIVVSACDGPAASDQAGSLLSAGSTADVGPPPPQANAMAVVVGPTGLHPR